MTRSITRGTRRLVLGAGSVSYSQSLFSYFRIGQSDLYDFRTSLWNRFACVVALPEDVESLSDTEMDVKPWALPTPASSGEIEQPIVTQGVADESESASAVHHSRPLDIPRAVTLTSDPGVSGATPQQPLFKKSFSPPMKLQVGSNYYCR